MAKVIAIANQKGGVGKTTTCVNLSSCVAALGKKVLVVDLDPQGNTTSGYGVAKKGQQSNIYTCLINDDDIRQAIVHTKFNADLIASNTQLAGAVVELVELPRRENRLRSILAPLIPLYDYVFIDCPPSLDDRQRSLRLRYGADPHSVRVLCAGGAFGADEYLKDRAQKIQPLPGH